MSSEMSNIKLESSDGVVFDVEPEVVRCCGTIKTMLEDGLVAEAGDEPIPLPNVSTEILRKILVWVRHHMNDPAPAEYTFDEINKCTDDICIWDVDFMRVDQGMLIQIMLAANYLDIKELITLCCKTLANMIKNKSAEQIRRTFNIENDFAPGEEEKIRIRNQFCEEKKQSNKGV